MNALQYGIVADQTLVTLYERSLPGLDTPGYHAGQLCPPRRFWQSHPCAPWNAFWSDSPADWRDLDARWDEVEDADPAAPWNQPEPSRDPADYADDEGNPILWAAPEVIPLLKLDKPTTFNPATHDCEPTLVWFADRVERDWVIVPLAPEKSRALGRAALRTQWEALPYAWIRGPYRDKFEAADRLLDEGDDEAAINLIKYATALPDTPETPLAVFEAVRAQMMAGITSLPK